MTALSNVPTCSVRIKLNAAESKCIQIRDLRTIICGMVDVVKVWTLEEVRSSSRLSCFPTAAASTVSYSQNAQLALQLIVINSAVENECNRALQ